MLLRVRAIQVGLMYREDIALECGCVTCTQDLLGLCQSVLSVRVKLGNEKLREQQAKAQRTVAANAFDYTASLVKRFFR